MPESTRWIKVASSVLLEDDPTAARLCLTDHLLSEFDARAGARVTYDQRSRTLSLHGFPQDVGFDARRWPYGVRTLEQTHPLLKHYLRTGSLEPRMLLGPGQTSRMLPAPLVSLLRSLDLGVHQMAIPIRNEPGALIEGYVLVRDEPFPHWALPRVRALHAFVRGLEVHLRLLTATTAMTARTAEDEAGLTPRERTILAMVAESRKAESIGRSLGISARTVHKHLENVYRKLGVSDRVAAVTSAHRRGLVLPHGEASSDRSRLDPADDLPAPR